MALQYDFDMGSVMPSGLPDAFHDPTTAGIANQRVAMFRDTNTVAALKSADQQVQTLFLDSGFALETYDSGAPPGKFPHGDQAARIEVVKRFSRNLAAGAFESADWGGFDLRAFMQALQSAEPLEDDALLAPTQNARRIDPELATAMAASRKMRQRRKIAMGGLIAGLLLLLFVAGRMLI